MGLTFWSDRTFETNEDITDALYHCAMPLTNIMAITTDMITNAFKGISKMYGGGDSEEAVLLGRFSEEIPRGDSIIWDFTAADPFRSATIRFQ